MATISDYYAKLRTRYRKPKIKVELLHREDESVYQSITSDLINASGSLRISNVNGLRRYLDLTLKNTGGDYLPDIDGLWLGGKIKLWLGEEINGEDYWIPQGVFVLNNPDAESYIGSKVLRIKAIDKFGMLDGTVGGELNSTYIVPVSSNIYTVLRELLNGTSTNDLPTDIRSPVLDQIYASEVTPYTLRKEVEDVLGNVIIELQGMLSANVFYNVNGEMVFERDSDDSTKGSLWDFSTEEFNYLGATRTYKFNEVYNAVRVIGDNVDGDIALYEAQNINLVSPTSIQNLGYQRTFIINDPIINTDALAEDRANYELKRKTALYSDISLTVIPMYHLDVDNVITLTDASLGLNRDRFLINDITIPLTIGGQMTIQASKTEELV
jgi:hypothetical protein